MISVESAARVAYEAKREFDWVNGDYNDTPWATLTGAEREVWVAMTEYCFSEPIVAPETLHREFTGFLLVRGWGIAEKKKIDRKQSHWLAAWDKLTAWQKKSFEVFIDVLNSAPIRDGRLLAKSS